MKAAIYGRISTIGKGQDVGLQLKDLRAYAASRGWLFSRSTWTMAFQDVRTNVQHWMN